MKKLIRWLEIHWREYLHTKTTAIALVLVYFEAFHYNAIDTFWHTLGANSVVGTAIGNIIVGFLIRSKK